MDTNFSIKDIDKVDYWFLDSVIRSSHELHWIIPYDRDFTTHRDRTPGTLTTNQIVEVMYRLFQDGFLSAITPTDYQLLDSELIDNLLAKSFSPSRQEIKIALYREENVSGDSSLEPEFEENDLIYFVTKQGGARWESVSQPKWNQYFRGSREWETIYQEIWDLYISRKSRIICGADREIIKKILSIERLLEHPQFIRYPIAGTEIWQTFTPWYPVYWKTLPCGYLVSYQVEFVEVDENLESANKSPELIEQIKQAKEWFWDITHWWRDYYTENNID